MSTKIDPEHRIDDLLYQPWDHCATEGCLAAAWREPATRSCRIVVHSQTFRVS